MEYTNSHIAVLGFGAEGKSAVAFLREKGARVTVLNEKEESSVPESDMQTVGGKGVSFVFGPFPSLTAFDCIVRSPGIPPTHPRLVEAHKHKVPITSATKLFFDLCPCPIIGVTGTKGKGTTSTLIFEMLKGAGFDSYLGGNIGIPPLLFLSQLTPNSRVVLEMSSFQLIDLHKSPSIAVVLMVTREHQDYHNGQDEYTLAKTSIVKFQKKNDTAIINADYKQSARIADQACSRIYWVSRKNDVAQGCYVADGNIIWRNDGQDDVIIPVKDIALPGKHNWENVAAAVTVAKILSLPADVIRKVVTTFKGLEHRIEFVREVHGVSYYDDSFSTTPETAIAAIEAFEQPKILILGGSSKNSDFSDLAKTISAQRRSIRGIIGIGVEWERIKEALRISSLESGIRNQESGISRNNLTGIPVREGCGTMEEVVAAAAEMAKKGDVVLLSPACASFGMFENYKQRGEQFKTAVNTL